MDVSPALGPWMMLDEHNAGKRCRFSDLTIPHMRGHKSMIGKKREEEMVPLNHSYFATLVAFRSRAPDINRGCASSGCPTHFYEVTEGA